MATLKMQSLLYGNNLDKNLPYAIQIHACHKIGREIPDMQDSTRHKVYDSLIWKDVGELCLFGLKEQNGSHENVEKSTDDNFGMSQINKKFMTSHARIGIIWKCLILPSEILILILPSLSSMAR
jgi:hypothetical protein